MPCSYPSSVAQSGCALPQQLQAVRQNTGGCRLCCCWLTVQVGTTPVQFRGLLTYLIKDLLAEGQPGVDSCSEWSVDAPNKRDYLTQGGS